MDINEINECMSLFKNNTLVSGKEAAQGILLFGKIIKRFNQLSKEDQKQFLIDGFRKIYDEDKSAIEEFERRHPESWLNKYISR